MKLVIEDPKIVDKFEILFSNLVYFTEFVNIINNDEGLYIHGMDKCKVCLFNLYLKCEWFTLYEIDEEEQYYNSAFCIPSRLFNKVLSVYRPDQCLEININNIDSLSVEFLKGTKTCDKSFILPMADIPIGNGKINIDSESDADIIITSKKLAELVNQLELFDDVITFILSESDVILKSEGDGSMTVKLSLEDNHLIDYSIVEGLNLEVSFSIKHFKLLTAFSKLDDEVKIVITKDRPMIVSYCLGNDSKLVMALVPKLNYN